MHWLRISLALKLHGFISQVVIAKVLTIVVANGRIRQAEAVGSRRDSLSSPGLKRLRHLILTLRAGVACLLYFDLDC